MQAMLKSQLAQTHGHNFQIFFFIKSGIGADAIRAAGSKRR
jgi:6-pyruvoyl-tetrahydropterin synthase